MGRNEKGQQMRQESTSNLVQETKHAPELNEKGDIPESCAGRTKKENVDSMGSRVRPELMMIERPDQPVRHTDI